jgi:hypothetical protein
MSDVGHGQDRRDIGDRRTGEPVHVEVEGLSNGARELVEEMVVEVRSTRDEFRDAKRLIIKAVVAVVSSAFVMVFGLGAWYTKVNLDIAARPTHGVTRVMIDSVKADILLGIAAQEVRTDGVISVLTEHTTVLERLKERSETAREDIERIDRAHELMRQ